MITVLIMVIFGVAMALVRNRRKMAKGEHSDKFRKEDGFDRKFRIFWYGFFAFFIGLILAGIIGLFTVYHQPTLHSEKELVVFRDNRETAGGFFLGIGSIKDRRYYEFFYKSENGGIKYGRLPIDTSVYEKEELAQVILKIFNTEKKFLKPWYKWIAIKGEPEEKHEIWIPKGTIKKNLTLDLK